VRATDLNFPNVEYKETLRKVVGYFEEYPGVYAVVLIGSLARGKAVEGSCIDLCVFLDKRCLNRLARDKVTRAKAYARMKGHVCYHDGDVEGGILFANVRVDIAFTDGNFKQYAENSFDIAKDELETTVGNLLVYGVPLYEKDERYQALKKEYLPYYGEKLRKARLKGTSEEFRYKIWKTNWLAERGEYFAALDALLEAQKIFLQHLFVKKKKYPLDYTKWLKEQCTQILAMPALYKELVSIVEGVNLTKNGITEKTRWLERLFEKHAFAT
jgi:hypothetical protein